MIGMKRVVVAFFVVGLAGVAACGGTPAGNENGSGDAILARAFEDRAADLPVEGAGKVVRILSDDDEGSRHQRFILRLGSGQTLLVAHNIDIAPRVDGLALGDHVAFKGVYEWSEQGGTIHWTHHDPAGEHAPGWLRLDARLYD